MALTNFFFVKEGALVIVFGPVDLLIEMVGEGRFPSGELGEANPIRRTALFL